MATEQVVHYVGLKTFSEDRPGSAARVLKFVSTRGANVVQTFGAKLGRFFGMLVQIAASPEVMAQIKRDYRTVLRGDVGHDLRYTGARGSEEGAEVSYTHSLILWAPDARGIAAALAERLGNAKANIVRLAARTTSAAESGACLFVLEMLVDVPSGREEVVREQVRTLLDEHSDWDIELTCQRRSPDHRELRAPASSEGYAVGRTEAGAVLN